MYPQYLDTINAIIREEHGSSVTLDSKLIDAGLDSLGIVMLLLSLQEKYNIFKDVPSNENPISIEYYLSISIKELIDKCI